jgi:hypothetical protein
MALGLFALVLLLFASESVLRADTILGTTSGNGTIDTVQPNSNTTLSALIGIGPTGEPCFNVGACPQIALIQGIGPSAAGTIFTIDPSNPNFAAVVSLLTDGILEYIYTGIVPGPSYGTTSGGAVEFPETFFGTSPGRPFLRFKFKSPM